MNDKSQRGSSPLRDLTDVIVIFSILILILVTSSLFGFFEYISAIAAQTSGFKIIELLLVISLLGVSYSIFSQRRWGDSRRHIKRQEKLFEELHDNVNRLRSTVDLSPDAITVHRDGQLLFINKAGVQLFGAHSEEELIGKTMKELVHYSYHEKVSKRLEQMSKYMKQVPVMDLTIRRIDGSYIDVSVASTGVFYHAIPHVITILRDITERKKNEEIKSQLASIVLNSSDAIYAMTLDGMVQSWNPGAEKLYGFTAEEAIGSYISIVVPKDKTSEVNYLLGKINKGQRIEAFETKRVRKDETVLDVSLTLSPIRDASGIITSASAISRDITYKKQVEQELRRYAEELALSNEELYVFSYAASHDLQEPLRTIQSFIKLLKEKYRKKLDKEVDEFLVSSDDGVTRMYRLITDFLMYSRVGSQLAVMEPTDCNIALNDALENLKMAIKESKAQIKHYKLPVVHGNQLQLTQVFQNLISNAIKFQGEKKPMIEISAEKKDKQWVIAVKDNGIGIEQWFSERIFIVFQKLHNHEKYPGSGIGLALCKRIIEKNGGKIWFESEAGKGSTFYFTLSEAKDKAV